MYERDHPYREIVDGNYQGLSPAAIPLLDSRSPIRPDGPYALGKAMGEAGARFYSDEFSISAICLRLGTVNEANRPVSSRHFATLLSHKDLVHLVDCAIRAPDDLRFGIYYGVSNNAWRLWDIVEASKAINYTPHDNAELYRPVGNLVSGA
jgi:uronate dehydrogenase